MTKSLILFISGHQEDARELAQMVQDLPLALHHVPTVQHARLRLPACDYQAVLTEARLPDGNWLDVMHLVRDDPRDIPILVTDPHADARLWSLALNQGAYDLLAQPYYAPEVRRILCSACRRLADIPSPMMAI
jgi:two-component system response regulator PilR (NtrC family)